MRLAPTEGSGTETLATSRQRSGRSDDRSCTAWRRGTGTLLTLSGTPETKWQFEYADVSEDPEAVDRAHTPPLLRRTLAALGFHRLGASHAWLRHRSSHLVREVWVTEDGRVEALTSGSDPTIELCTLFADGAVVTTLLRPDFATWLLLAPGLRWHRADRYDSTMVSGTIGELERRHRERVAEHEKREGAVVVPFQSMREHLAIRLRTNDLRSARMEPHIRGSLAAGGVAATVTVFALMDRISSHQGAMPFALRFALALAGALVTGYLAFLLALWMVVPHVVILRPGPIVGSARELLDRAAALPRRRLPQPARG